MQTLGRGWVRSVKIQKLSVPYPSGKVLLPMQSTTVNFATAARTLGREARERGLLVPGFRCPPRVIGLDRTLKRTNNGVTVAVRVKDRPWVAILADMIEGVIAANRLTPPLADRFRGEMWLTLGFTCEALPITRPPQVA